MNHGRLGPADSTLVLESTINFRVQRHSHKPIEAQIWACQLPLHMFFRQGHIIRTWNKTIAMASTTDLSFYTLQRPNMFRPASLRSRIYLRLSARDVTNPWTGHWLPPCSRELSATRLSSILAQESNATFVVGQLGLRGRGVEFDRHVSWKPTQFQLAWIRAVQNCALWSLKSSDMSWFFYM